MPVAALSVPAADSTITVQDHTGSTQHHAAQRPVGSESARLGSAVFPYRAAITRHGPRCEDPRRGQRLAPADLPGGQAGIGRALMPMGS